MAPGAAGGAYEIYAMWNQFSNKSAILLLYSISIAVWNLWMIGDDVYEILGTVKGLAFGGIDSE